VAEGRLALTPDQSIGEQLAGWGKVALIETSGRSSGRPASAAVGFVEEADGSLLVAAGADTADWVRNLRAQRRCRVTIGETTHDYEARELDEEEREHAAAVTALILKYGTPAEKLGRGPVFRLVRAD
jgi:deazaflavin-dependent oxidoreductase (nitroreductase family)